MQKILLILALGAVFSAGCRKSEEGALVPGDGSIPVPRAPGLTPGTPDGAPSGGLGTDEVARPPRR